MVWYDMMMVLFCLHSWYLLLLLLFCCMIDVNVMEGVGVLVRRKKELVVVGWIGGVKGEVQQRQGGEESGESDWLRISWRLSCPLLVS